VSGREVRVLVRWVGIQHLGLAFWLPQLAAEKTHFAHRNIAENDRDRSDDPGYLQA
jgi:hypothetical protein